MFLVSLLFSSLWLTNCNFSILFYYRRYQKTTDAVKVAGEKTTSVFGTFSGSVARKLGEVKNSNAFKSFEERVGSAGSYVKVKMNRLCLLVTEVYNFYFFCRPRSDHAAIVPPALKMRWIAPDLKVPRQSHRQQSQRRNQFHKQKIERDDFKEIRIRNEISTFWTPLITTILQLSIIIRLIINLLLLLFS